MSRRARRYSTAIATQLRDYCGSTGARRGMLVFMSIAKVIVTRY